VSAGSWLALALALALTRATCAQDASFHAAARAAPAATVQRTHPAPVPVTAAHAAQQPTALPLPTGVGQCPTAPPREAKPWSAEEDALIIEMHRQRASGGDVTHTYQTIAASIGRSANAVKCRWQNKLKLEGLD
jgi:hypothetical protein